MWNSSCWRRRRARKSITSGAAMAGHDGRTDRTVCLFDVDGTLTRPRGVITPAMHAFMQTLREKMVVGLVGGSDLAKITEQMGKTVLQDYDFVFSENGLVAYKDGALLGKMSIQKHMGDDKLQQLINFTLLKLSQITLPVKRGTFIEFRSGLVNVCPVGRSCTQAERDQFAAYDAEHHIRDKLVDELKTQFPELGLQFVIGGQISIDVYPDGWDKRFSLGYIEKENYDVVHFFGDKTAPGGNDHKIFEDSRTIGHTVTSPDDTRQQLEELFYKK